MNDSIFTTLWPLAILAPSWFALIKLGSLLERLNKGRFGRKRLAIIDAAQSIRVPLFLITVSIFFRHVTHEVFPVKDNYMLIFMDKHGYFFISVGLLTATILTFCTTYKKDILRSYELEEKSNRGSQAKHTEKTYVSAISKVINGVWVVCAVILMLDHFGVPASSILAFGGMGSLVIGFAAKDILSDILCGMLLYFDNQFRIDEWVKIDSLNIEGTVSSIGWRVTKVQTFDNRPVFVPNKFLSNAVIQNVSRRESMRFKETLCLSLESVDNVPNICREIKQEIFMNHDGIDHDKSIIVNLKNFDGEVANIFISAYSKSADTVGFHAIKQDIWVKIYAILVAHGAKVKAPMLGFPK